MTESREARTQMAGPRLAIRVAAMIEDAFASRSDLTQRDVAKRLGVGEARVSQLLHGDGNLHIASVARLFAALDMSLDFSITSADGTPIEPTSRRGGRRSKRDSSIDEEGSALGDSRPTDAYKKIRVYTHQVRLEPDGDIDRVVSVAFNQPEGVPIDFPMLTEASEFESLVSEMPHKFRTSEFRAEKVQS
ncbi:helix-turn-helix domain-containing protein [Pseudoclavibacter sp. RFBA6]|uniref:helix-turn-helix domain-containing protein n=1 Tax=Pseudoclavibacter sp. RFBA6 TaxID=2080573 RepID=UPI000CE91A08|nr:helix-turn-helix domain-containing protein [Pseudoclavibacter sp. RFBA6]PPG39488.1 hypothetical protein C5C17_11905 [Pseudoclavibacter sp. RFBA6]